MSEEVLGSKYLVVSGKMFQAVVPLGSSFQSNAAPPQGCTGIPRCSLYQALSALGSFALKKTPPMPVTRVIDRYLETQERESYLRSRTRRSGASSVVERLID